jgi:uncharacterized protein YcfJ
MKQKRTPFALACAAAGVVMCQGAFAVEYGSIVSSTPVLGQVSVPQRECVDEQVSVQRPPSGGGAVAGAVIGGVVGNAIGAGAGRAAATALGVVGGAAIGDRVEANGTPPATATVQRCRQSSRLEDRIIGYDVVYEYAGTRRTVRLPQDPGAPGTRIALEVNVSPVAASRTGRQGTPVPSASAGGTAAPEDRPVGVLADEAPRPDGAPVYYAPAPVLVAPYPYFYAPPTLWIGGTWGGHRRFHGGRW